MFFFPFTLEILRELMLSLYPDLVIITALALGFAGDHTHKELFELSALNGLSLYSWHMTFENIPHRPNCVFYTLPHYIIYTLGDTTETYRYS